MEQIDLLQSLKDQRSALLKSLKGQEKVLGEKLFEFISKISDYDGLKMMPMYCTIRTPSIFNKKDSPFEVQTEIRFFNEKGEVWDNGQPKSDFGSDITLNIFANHIELNYGTCGYYTKENKGQMTRVFLVVKLWENEETICSIAKGVVNIKDYEDLLDVRCKINDINIDIENAEREKERKEILSKIYSAKYICKRTKEFDCQLDKDGNYIRDNYKWHYYCYEEIKKVTDKNLLTYSSYFKTHHRHNLEKIISDIKLGTIFLRDEVIDYEPILTEALAN